ncbi:nucleotide-diphospho-sugar transferase [Hyphopichia burtonii NRRL Y-1933]|uniref:Nucleotide-diphospho-sugar transferase n=1 Tax=Hyphopichia burtonii NRRL Y-1933 TaxID=984485 RepID=A0A1E4RBS1_9ASCO|nr:nucleotide-diphospho-sugar transferase [Hyphopichia burtonii NRRL Y-1933]ODV64707.1 nucleotide-diphospho-sugar transferase [Hyphopichia burtonii NRRL Y-1933]
MYKHTKKIVVVCLLITVINIIYSCTIDYSLYVSSLKNDYFSKLSPTSKIKEITPISLIGYHHDVHNDLMIIQKQPDPNNEFNDEIASHFWQFMKSEYVNDNNANKFDIRLIDGYNYEKDLIEIHSNDLRLNVSHFEMMESENLLANYLVDFFKNLWTIFEKTDPKIPGINNGDHYSESKKNNKYSNNDGKMPVYGGHLRENYLDEAIRTKEMLASYIQLSEHEINSLANSHQSFIDQMPQDFPKEIYDYGKPHHFMQGDGIVYLGGGKYNQLALTSIRTLRNTGSKLPVEIIIPKRSDYDIDLCSKILPKFNAKCKILTDYLPKHFGDKISGFQLKNIALLISSFERILYLDADNLPIKNPDILFINKPFANKHLVVWPDLWRRSTSPLYYDIAKINVDTTSRVRNSYPANDDRGFKPDEISMHDCDGAIPEASSETGQVLIDKKVHFKTLILSMYYNYYGPDYYYPLFSQGAAGEGDKETFIAAAHKLKLPYYQVKEFNREFGPFRGDTGKHEVFGMAQYDPIIDYIQANEDVESKPEDGKTAGDYYNEPPTVYAKNAEDKGNSNYKYHYFKSSNLFFLHANWPKFDLVEMFLRNSYGRGPKGEHDKRRRLYSYEILDELKGYDFELEVMSNLDWCFCKLSNIHLSGVPEPDSDERNKICQEITQHIEFLKQDRHD